MKARVEATGEPVARERRDGGHVRLSTFIPLKIRKRGVRKVVVRPDGQVEAPGKVATQHDQPLLVALTRAFYWQQLLDDGVVASGSEIAQREGLHHSTVNELLRLTLLEPAIIQSILAGHQPRCMSLLWFQRNPLPDRLGGAAGGRGGVRRLIGLRALDHPRHIAVAFGAFADQEQVAALDGAAEIGDRCFETALAAPNVGQQPLADVARDGLPALAGGFGEVGK